MFGAYATPGGGPNIIIGSNPNAEVVCRACSWRGHKPGGGLALRWRRVAGKQATSELFDCGRQRCLVEPARSGAGAPTRLRSISASCFRYARTGILKIPHVTADISDRFARQYLRNVGVGPVEFAPKPRIHSISTPATAAFSRASARAAGSGSPPIAPRRRSTSAFRTLCACWLADPSTGPTSQQALSEGQSLATAANSADFSDQAHLGRTMSRFMGVTPKTIAETMAPSRKSPLSPPP